MKTFQHSRPFTARFDSDGCCGEIEEGDRIVMIDGEAMHVDCVDHDECPDNAECD